MKEKKDDNYSNDVMKEFIEGAGAVPEAEPVTDLGKVDLNRGYEEQQKRIAEDPRQQKMAALIDYHTISLESLPSEGRFYEENMTISIRACRVNEIREFSGVDESNPNDVIDKLGYILASCTKVHFGDRLGSYRDILDHDRLSIIFAIRELTFKNGETSIKIPVPANACKTPGCRPQKEVLFTRDMFERAKPSKRLEKYFIPGIGYKIQTKSQGEIFLAPPTIGVANAVREWAIEREGNQQQWDSNVAMIIPFITKEWRGLDKESIFRIATEISGWSIEKYSLVYRLIEELNFSVGMSQTFHAKCDSCGGELEIPIQFHHIDEETGKINAGIRDLFVPNLSNLSDELL